MTEKVIQPGPGQQMNQLTGMEISYSYSVFNL